jgi:hypothetical protein
MRRTKVALGILVLLAIAGLVGYALFNYADSWTAILRFGDPRNRGELTVWLVDREGNPVRIARGPLSFYSGDVEVYAILGEVVFEVEMRGISSYDWESTVYMVMYDPNGIPDSTVTITRSGTSDQTKVTVSFDKVLADMPFDQYGLWRIQIYALVTVSSGSLQDQASSEVIELQVEYRPDSSLSIVYVGISAGLI